MMVLRRQIPDTKTQQACRLSICKIRQEPSKHRQHAFDRTAAGTEAREWCYKPGRMLCYSCNSHADFTISVLMSRNDHHSLHVADD